MPPSPAASDPTPHDFDALLRGVSRSFYLSIRLLPAGLRRPVGLAYLLARATDTVADAALAPAAERLALLGRMDRAVQATRPDDHAAPDLAALSASVSDAQERALLVRWPGCLAQLGRLPLADAADVRTVLGHIVRGQRLDLERFGGAAGVAALPDAATLREYAWLVAGSVGEFWTDLCGRHVERYASRPAGEMRALGRSFGMGLQLVNIVRDAGEDLAAGRCYFPVDELATAGVSPGEILRAPERFLPVWQRWQDEARQRLDDGMAYALAVNPRRIRAAVALPALLVQRTLVRLRAAGPRALAARVKVPRREVHALLLRMAITGAGRGALQSQWDNAAR
jgi:farnesyl-diphosphate farnesyltransferase